MNSVEVWVVHYRTGNSNRWQWHQTIQLGSQRLAVEIVRDLVRSGHFAYLTQHPTPLPEQFIIPTARQKGGVYVRVQ